MCLHSRKSVKRQQGVVIVVALFIVALVASMAYVMMFRLSRDTRQTTLILRHIEAEDLSTGSVAWARDHLRNDWEHQKQNQVIDMMPVNPPVKEVNGYQIKSSIDDLQARYNLNNLSDKSAQSDFVRLIRFVMPKIPEEQANQIASAASDWVTPVTQESEFDKYYLSLPAPYRAAHRAMVSPTELRLVKGMTPELYLALMPFVAALPAGTQINLQTAPVEVLMTLDPTMTVDAAKAIVQLRSAQIIVSTDAFFNLDAVKNHRLPPEKLTVSSSYFLLQTEVSIENQHVLLYTVLERAVNRNKAIVNVMYQGKGSW